MSKQATSDDAGGKHIPFKLHPRVFAALGADLVTSDVVAIIELVKNSYDAFAHRVDVRFATDDSGRPMLEIEDDGHGMDHDTIDNVWCTVATPFRLSKKETKRAGKVRRVTGAKGLGRLSAARLGKRFELVTKTRGGECWKVDVSWEELSKAQGIDYCFVIRTPHPATEIGGPSGTRLRMYDLSSPWSEDRVEELREGLSRLISPFSKAEEFAIYLTVSGDDAKPTEIETSDFLNKPVYRLRGEFDTDGTLSCRYSFRPYRNQGRGPKTSEYQWKEIQADLKRSFDFEVTDKIKPSCGSFEFEVRAWELEKESLAEAEETFSLSRSDIRSQIRAFKGLSVYRDGVLVLPKSETNRDWLGLDLRRVSLVGRRLSTSQIVGYVAISAEDNRRIEDTSDRERLVDTPEAKEFKHILLFIVGVLEMERNQDRVTKEQPMTDLLESLSPAQLLDQAQEIVAENGSASDVMPLINGYTQKVERVRRQLQTTFTYYSRLASIGTIAQKLVHEVGHNVSIIGVFLTTARRFFAGEDENRSVLEKRATLAERALHALGHLADIFRPLASRNFTRNKRTASLSEVWDACVEAKRDELEQAGIKWDFSPKTPDTVRVDPGELWTVFYNLLDNALYWLGRQKNGARRILVETRLAKEKGRVVCFVHDSGPGVEEKEQDRIFLPGVTKRPNGFGMGLTVASEVVVGYGGKMGVKSPGRLGGATFRFDLPAGAS